MTRDRGAQPRTAVTVRRLLRRLGDLGEHVRTDRPLSVATRAMACDFYITEARTAAGTRGLGPFLEFESLDRWSVHRGIGPVRAATATVTWRAPGGTTTSRHYLLTLTTTRPDHNPSWQIHRVTPRTPQPADRQRHPAPPRPQLPRT